MPNQSSGFNSVSKILRGFLKPLETSIPMLLVFWLWYLHCTAVNCTVDDQMYLPCDGNCDPTCVDDPLEEKICPLCIQECHFPSGNCTG